MEAGMARVSWGWLAVLVVCGCQDSKLRPVLEDVPPPPPDEREGDASKVAEPSSTPGETTVVTGNPVCLTCPPLAAVPLTRVARANPIPAENARQGDPGWRSGSRSWDRQVELYASTESAKAGDRIKVRVSTSVSSTASASV